MKFFKLPKYLKQDTYIERVIDGYGYTDFTEEERVKLQDYRITLYYRARRLDWSAFLVFSGMIILALFKNIDEGYTFGNGVIFGFIAFGLVITFIPLTRNIRDHIEKYDKRILFNEKKILHRFKIIEQNNIKKAKENDK